MPFALLHATTVAAAPRGAAAPAKRGSAAARAPAASCVAARRATFFAGSELQAAHVRASRMKMSPLCASASSAPVVLAAAAPPKAAPRGADMKALGYSVLAGVVIWLLPAPAGVTLKAWHLLAHFVATIVGIITSVRAS